METTAQLKYLGNFWRTLETPLINCEISLVLTWLSTSVITNSTGAGRFVIADEKLYVPVVTLPNKGNVKLVRQIKSGFKRAINWNKYQSDLKTFTQNQYLNHSVDPSFQGVNRLFLLSFENKNDRASHSEYYLSKVEIKGCNVKIDGRNLFN